jgi:hypothetical protein
MERLEARFAAVRFLGTFPTITAALGALDEEGIPLLNE